MRPEVRINWSLKVSAFQVGTDLTKEGRHGWAKAQRLPAQENPSCVS